jgi:hypothetical protein
MRFRATLSLILAAVPMLLSTARADDHDPSHRSAEEGRRAEEAQRAEASRHAEERAKAPPADPHGAHHDWKLHDLEVKEKAGGKFSPEEKEAFEHLKTERQKRYTDLAKADADREHDRTARRIAAQRAAIAHYRATDPAFKQEFQRDAEIMAQLTRAREVAQAESRDDAVVRIDRLIQKEKDRHDKWVAAHG